MELQHHPSLQKPGREGSENCGSSMGNTGWSLGWAVGGSDPPHTPSWLTLLVGVSALDVCRGCAGHQWAALAPCFWGLTAMGLRHFPVPRGPPQAGADPPQQSPLSNPKHLSHCCPPRIHTAQLAGAGIWLRAHSSLPGGVHYLPGMFNSWGRKKASSGVGGAMPPSPSPWHPLFAAHPVPSTVAGLGPSPPFASTPCARRRGP